MTTTNWRRWGAVLAVVSACASEDDDAMASASASAADDSGSAEVGDDGEVGEMGEAGEVGDDTGADDGVDDGDDGVDDDGDDTAAGACDFEMTAGVRVTVDVSWAGGIAVLEGSGAIDIWIVADLVPGGDDVQVGGHVCRVVLPDFATGILAGNETYGTEFPDAIWTSPTMPTIDAAATLSSHDPGAALHLQPGAVLLGGMMGDALNDPWPSDWHQLQLVDHDGDSKSGITALAKTGNGYANPRIDILNSNARAQAIWLVSRTILELDGVADTCDEASGEATVDMQNHAVGCDVAGGGQCSDGQTTTLDNNLPVFEIQGGTFELVRVDDGSDCAAVLAALP
jgi:hypothetical protein